MVLAVLALATACQARSVLKPDARRRLLASAPGPWVRHCAFALGLPAAPRHPLTIMASDRVFGAMLQTAKHVAAAAVAAARSAASDSARCGRLGTDSCSSSSYSAAPAASLSLCAAWLRLRAVAAPLSRLHAAQPAAPATAAAGDGRSRTSFSGNWAAEHCADGPSWPTAGLEILCTPTVTRGGACSSCVDTSCPTVGSVQVDPADLRQCGEMLPDSLSPPQHAVVAAVFAARGTENYTCM